MAKFKALALSFYDGRLIQPDEIIDIEGEAGPNFVRVSGPVPKQVRPEVAGLIAAVRLKVSASGGDPGKLSKADFDTAIADLPNKPADDVVKAALAEVAASVA